MKDQFKFWTCAIVAFLRSLWDNLGEFGIFVLIPFSSLYLYCIFLMIPTFLHVLFVWEDPYIFLRNTHSLFICIIYGLNAFLFLVFLYFSLIRLPKHQQEKFNLKLLTGSQLSQTHTLLQRVESMPNRFKAMHNSFSKFYLVCLAYLSPSILIWFFPLIKIKWLRLSDETNQDVLNDFNYIGILFIIGLQVTLTLVIRNNLRTMKINVKEEIKNELNIKS